MPFAKVGAGRTAETVVCPRLFSYRQMEMGLDAAYQLAVETMACNMMTEDAAHGIDAFMAKEKPEWKHR